MEKLTIFDKLYQCFEKFLTLCPSFGHFYIKCFGLKFPYRNKLYLSQYIKAKENNDDITSLPKAEGMLRKIQLANLKIMKELDSVCKSQNIEYWVVYGTQLGAIRHKGYIPWDDDIDISMMRDDYEKLSKIFNEVTTDKDLYMETMYNKHLPGMFTPKIKHKKLPFLFIDIFPWDYYHSKLTPEQREEVSKKITEHRNKITKDKSLLKLGFDECYNYIKSYTKENILDNKTPDPSTEPDIFIPLDYPHDSRMRIFSYNDILPAIDSSFENTTLKQAKSPETLAEGHFGKNYMDYPPEIALGHCRNVIITPKEQKLLDEYIKTEL